MDCETTANPIGNYESQVIELARLLAYRQWGWQPDIDWTRFPDVAHLTLEELERQLNH